MMTEDYANIPRRELRQFGVGLGLLCALVGGLLIWNDRAIGALVVAFGVFLFIAFWCDWPGIRSFYAGWMRVAKVIAGVMTTVMLTVLYFLVLTPTALLGRACGQKFVARGFREERSSYWETHSGSDDRSSCEKQS